MPHIKNALIRYRIIDRAISNKYNRYPTKKDLREACEEYLYGSVDGLHICDSTIEKDLYAMKMEHDAPIKYSRRHHGYYYSEDNYSLNDIPLSDKDLESICFAVNTLKQFRDVSMFKQFGQAIDKIVDRVSVEIKQPLNESNHSIQFETAFSEGGSEFLATIYEAICNGFKVGFVYRSFSSNSFSNRMVTPVLLKQFRNRWYLISFDSSSKSIKTFALDRMKEVIIGQEKADQNHGFNSVEYFQFATGITVNKKSIPEKVKLKANEIASKYIISQPFHHSQTLISNSIKYHEFELTIFITEEFVRSLLGFSSEIEVLSPKSLRETIKKRVSEMNKIYK